MKIRSRSADLIFKFTHKDLHTKLISKFKFVGHLLSEEIPSDPMLKLLSSGSREISLKASCWVSPPYASKTPAPRAFSSTARSGSPSRPPLRPPPRNHVAVFVCRPPRARPLRPRRYAPSPSGSFLAWRALTSGWMACGGRERKGRATMGRARCPPEAFGEGRRRGALLPPCPSSQRSVGGTGRQSVPPDSRHPDRARFSAFLCVRPPPRWRDGGCGRPAWSETAALLALVLRRDPPSSDSPTVAAPPEAALLPSPLLRPAAVSQDNSVPV